MEVKLSCMRLIFSWFFLLSWTPVLWAQGPLPPLFPKNPEASDIDEVEDLETEDDQDGVSLPPDELAPEAEADELSYSQEEQRSHFQFGAALALGTALPWQSYSISTYRLIGPHWAAGLYVGAGTFTDSTKIEGAAYDLKIKSRSAGLEGRYYLSMFEHLSVLASLGYANWDGNIAPNSTDDGPMVNDEKLATVYDASGVTTGLGIVLTWLWDSGFYLDWTAIGVRRSWILQKDLTRDSPPAAHLLEQTLEQAHFFGLTNIRCGLLF